MEHKTFKIIHPNNETIKLGGPYRIGYNTMKPYRLEGFNIHKWENGRLYYYMDGVDKNFDIESDMYCSCNIDFFKYVMNISEMRKDVYIY